MNYTIENNIAKIKKICSEQQVKELYLFGSALRDDFDQNSDIDFLVEFEINDILQYADVFFEFVSKMEGLFDRELDIITVNSIRNPILIDQINSSKYLLFKAA